MADKKRSVRGDFKATTRRRVATVLLKRGLDFWGSLASRRDRGQEGFANVERRKIGRAARTKKRAVRWEKSLEVSEAKRGLDAKRETDTGASR